MSRPLILQNRHFSHFMHLRLPEKCCFCPNFEDFLPERRSNRLNTSPCFSQCTHPFIYSRPLYIPDSRVMLKESLFSLFVKLWVFLRSPLPTCIHVNRKLISYCKGIPPTIDQLLFIFVQKIDFKFNNFKKFDPKTSVFGVSSFSDKFL